MDKSHANGNNRLIRFYVFFFELPPPKICRHTMDAMKFHIPSIFPPETNDYFPGEKEEFPEHMLRWLIERICTINNKAGLVAINSPNVACPGLTFFISNRQHFGGRKRTQYCFYLCSANHRSDEIYSSSSHGISGNPDIRRRLLVFVTAGYEEKKLFLVRTE